MPEAAEFWFTVASIWAAVTVTLCVITLLTGWLNGQYMTAAKMTYLILSVLATIAGCTSVLLG